MGGGKETPRQKMVGLMYLVLMALLAMNVSKEIINAFVTLNNKLESSIAQTESFNGELNETFASKLATIKATQPDNTKEIKRIESVTKTNDTVVDLTRDMCNDLVRRNLWLLVSAAGEIPFDDFRDIEYAYIEPTKGPALAYHVRNNPGDFQNSDGTWLPSQEVKKKTNALWDSKSEELLKTLRDKAIEKVSALSTKVTDLGLVVVDDHGPPAEDGGAHGNSDHGEDHGEDHDEYHNTLFHVDANGYIHIKDLSGYSKKDDYDTPTRILAGQDFEHIAPEADSMMRRLHEYRNKVIASIANYKSDTVTDKNGNPIVYDYKFNDTLIHDPEFLITEQDAKNYEFLVDSLLDVEVKEHRIAAVDKEAVKNIFVRMTIPKYVMNHGEKYPWIFGQFDHAPIVAASAVLTSVRSDILQVQTLASQLIASRIKVETFSFNKIEPLAFAQSSYINQGDSIGLKVMIAAFDSTEAMELRYWVDDSTQIKKAHTERDLSSMQTFNGEAGESVMMTSSVGDHKLYGEIAVKEKGIKKWKLWDFHYSVGAPSAAIAAADLQVLYLNWKNKIKVSASGYASDKVKVTCKGCSISSKPDKDGNLIATVTNTRAKECVLIVSGTDDKGKTSELAKEIFRVFPLPKPTAYFGGKAGGKMKKLDAGMIPKLTAKLGDSPLNVPYTVSGFMLYATKDGSPIREYAKNDRLTGKMRAIIKKIPKGANLTFTEIKVKGPGGKETTLEGGLVLRLN